MRRDQDYIFGVGWGRIGEEAQEGGSICRYLWLIHVDVWEKPTQYFKAIILQLNRFKLKKKRIHLLKQTLLQ